MSNKIPAHAKKVFSGVIFDIWQWEQELFDGTTATFERATRDMTTVVIPVVGDKILILDQEQPAKPPFITCPGGRVEPGEEPLEAVKRELLEETGYTADDWNVWYECNPVDKIDWIVRVYIARGCKKTSTAMLEPGERISESLISFDEFIALADNPKFRGGDTILKLLRAKYEPEEKEKLKRLFFPN